MATPGTASGENHSSDNQKCGLKLTRPRPSSSCCSCAMRPASALSSMVTPSWPIRRSRSRSSGQSSHSFGGSTAGFAIRPVYCRLGQRPGAEARGCAKHEVRTAQPADPARSPRPRDVLYPEGLSPEGVSLMRAVCRFAVAAVLCCLAGPAVGGQHSAAAAEGPPAAAKPSQKPAAQPEAQPEPQPDQPQYEGTVVVSSAGNGEKLINATAT